MVDCSPNGIQTCANNIIWECESFKREGTSESKFAQFEKTLRVAKRLKNSLKDPKFKIIQDIKKTKRGYEGKQEVKDIKNKKIIFGSGCFVFDSKSDLKRVMERNARSGIESYKSAVKCIRKR